MPTTVAAGSGPPAAGLARHYLEVGRDAFVCMCSAYRVPKEAGKILSPHVECTRAATTRQHPLRRTQVAMSPRCRMPNPKPAATQPPHGRGHAVHRARTVCDGAKRIIRVRVSRSIEATQR